MKINIANKLTIFRILLIPLFILFFMMSKKYQIGMDNRIFFRNISGVIFIIASLTDTLDGFIARKYNMITNFGKLMDPLADKMLVLSAIILLFIYDLPINAVWVIIIVLREIIISSIRLVAMERGVLIYASKYGKYKTAFQMLAITLFIFNFHLIDTHFYYFTYTIFYISEFLVIISLFDYIIKNKKVILEGINE